MMILQADRVERFVVVHGQIVLNQVSQCSIWAHHWIARQVARLPIGAIWKSEPHFRLGTPPISPGENPIHPRFAAAASRSPETQCQYPASEVSFCLLPSQNISDHGCMELWILNAEGGLTSERKRDLR
jgi:hypothetical protein